MEIIFLLELLGPVHLESLIVSQIFGEQCAKSWWKKTKINFNSSSFGLRCRLVS